MKIDLIENRFAIWLFVAIFIAYFVFFAIIGWPINPGIVFVLPFLIIVTDMDNGATIYRSFLISHGISRKGYLTAKLLKNITISLISSVMVAILLPGLYRLSTAVCVAVMLFFIGFAMSAVFSAVQFLEKDPVSRIALLFISFFVFGILMLFSAVISSAEPMCFFGMNSTWTGPCGLMSRNARI